MGEDHRRNKASEQERISLLQDRLEKIAADLERSQMAEYVDLLNRPWKLIRRNLVAGVSRGVGYAIGIAFFTTAILYLLQALGQLNLPIIGDYIADLVRIVQIQLEGKQY
ncbi:hypothetical protein HGI30_13510 [Paenibacillus albicereus]|uniref:Uncharacterized protein n=1 Tax=Paenibacillus albicereus TaxID=2726185 RepID=A0A6H2GYL2_9BACL|nr:DUF5665 domain-containing protein [Paenibacillus albicereus]QJC52477.1 hypothetical protein HGI30_13510 [Paenibacillus albicereus]